MIGSYDEYLNKTVECLNINPGKKIIIQTDDQHFLIYCQDRIDKNKLIVFNEIPRIKPNPNSVVRNHIKLEDRQMFGAYYLAIIKIISKCNTIITHSGNGGMWSVLFRGNINSVHQYLNSNWL